MLMTILKQILIILAGIAGIIGVLALLVSHADFERNRSRRIWGSTPVAAQLVFLGISCAIIGVIWFVSNLWQDWYYTEAPPPYASIEAAAEDGCVVLGWDGIIAGREHWEDFLDQAEHHHAAQISIAHSEGSSVNVVHVLFFDGSVYHYTKNTRYLHQKSQQQTYPYLLCLTYEQPEVTDTDFQTVTWVLTDKADLTAEEQYWAFAEEDRDYSLETLLKEYHWPQK